MKKRNIVIGILLVLTLITLAFTSKGTFAWYKFEEIETVDGAMGIVEAEITGGKMYPKYGTVPGEDVQYAKEFTIENKSNIDSFVRIGYTVVYGTPQGGEVLINSSKVEMTNAYLQVNGKSINTYIKEATSIGNVTTIYAYPLQTGENMYSYWRLKPGENITGSILVQGIDTTEQIPDIVLSVEGIQATKKALVEAEKYGWEPRYFVMN